QTRNHDQPAAIVRETETEITVVGMHRELNFGQTRRGKNADPSLALIEIMKTALDFVGGHFVFQIHINRGQNPARNGQKVGSENQLRRVERQLLENLASVTVS